MFCFEQVSNRGRARAAVYSALLFFFGGAYGGVISSRMYPTWGGRGELTPMVGASPQYVMQPEINVS